MRILFTRYKFCIVTHNKFIDFYASLRQIKWFVIHSKKNEIFSLIDLNTNCEDFDHSFQNFIINCRVSICYKTWYNYLKNFVFLYSISNKIQEEQKQMSFTQVCFYTYGIGNKNFVIGVLFYIR